MERKISHLAYGMFIKGKTGTPSSRDCIFCEGETVNYKLYDTVIAQRKIGSTFITVFLPIDWVTAITAQRINAFLPECVRVKREKGEFIVLYDGKKLKEKKRIVYNLIDDKVVTID